MRTWTYPSSSGSATYAVTHADNGVLGCDCKGWTIKKPGKERTCKHIRDVFATQGLVREVRGDYVFAISSLTETRALGYTVNGGTDSPQEATTVATTAEGMKASAMTEGRFASILDEDGYVIPAKFDAAFGNGEWMMDEKLDGHRVQIAKRGSAITMTLRSIPNLPPQILTGMATLPDGIYDGELLVNIPGAVSTDVPNLQFRSLLYFAIFDVIELLGTSTVRLTQAERRQLLEVAVPGDDGVMLVAQFAPTWANVQAIWARDGEGAILKRKSGTYRLGQRSADWIKVKGLEHHTATCTGFEAGSFGPTAVVLGTLEDGTPVRCKNKNTETLAATAANPAAYVGQRFVIQCQKRLRGSKHLRHPMMEGFGEFDHMAAAHE